MSVIEYKFEQYKTLGPIIYKKEKYKLLGNNALDFSKNFNWKNIVKKYIDLI